MTKSIKYLQETYSLVIGAQQSVLHAVAAPVSSINREIRRFGEDLLELMWMYEGVGLAAPQIGHSIRMFAYTQRDNSKKERKLLEEGVMINPKVVSASAEMVIDKEGCLSLPGLEGDVERPAWVVMTYTDLQGTTQIKKAVGYNARILLHELDHLDGILFTEKALNIKEITKTVPTSG